MNFLTAVVPIRQNSQRVKNKNFKKFNNENLLIHKINKLKKVGLFDEIIVNTDSDRAIKIAKKLDVSYHKRANFFASSKCPNYKFWQNIGVTTKSEYIFFTNCTSPLVKISTYKNIINLFKKKKNLYHSFNTVTLVKEFLYLNQKPINFDIKSVPNSQNLPNIYRLNFAINIFPREMIIKKMSVIGEKPYLFELDEIEGFDIDTNFQFNYANYLHQKLF